MTRQEWWEKVVAKVEQAFHGGELYCEIKMDSYRIHLADEGDVWDVRWHIDRKTGLMTNNYIYVNANLQTLYTPSLVFKLEDIGNQLATMKKMMTS